ncbi:MAG: hypothetical protein EKD82_05845 [Candidatus Symbiopectobacterium sp. PLON1]|nr:hypothetical protein [Candidatus Symbiopectobacterium sp. PLON1]
MRSLSDRSRWKKSFHLGDRWPPLLSLTGIACLIIGVAYAVNIRPQPVEKSFQSRWQVAAAAALRHRRPWLFLFSAVARRCDHNSG